MKVDFDSAKDAANQAKHGISLERAVDMDLESSVVLEDVRGHYGEKRCLAYGDIDGRMYVLFFTMRGEVLRAIGLRKANERERKRHEKT